MKLKANSLLSSGLSFWMTLPDRLEEWIAAAVLHAGLDGVVYGLSGGVDSAVVGALCTRALGDRALGLIMPAESLDSDEEDARLVAETFGMNVVTVRLDKPLRALLDVLPAADRSVSANLKPRLRMAVLYHWANLRSGMVVGTGNRSEWLAGYFTKHGDGGVDLLPLGGLYKTEVMCLAQALGVPERILAKPPSAGLWAGQTDEGEMGVAYEELDGVFRAMEAGMVGDLEPHLVQKVGAMKSRSHHKRVPPPIFEVLR